MSYIKINHHLDEIDEDKMELVLEDSSVLNENDSFYNPAIHENAKAKANQKIRMIARNKGDYHSYGDSDNKILLSKYDSPSPNPNLNQKNEVLISYDDIKDPASQTPEITKPASLKKAKPEFKIPKKRIKIIDLVSDESRARNEQKFSKPKKIPKFEEDPEQDSIDYQINLTLKPQKPILTPLTQEGEEFKSDLLFISPELPKANLNLTLKDTGTTSVVNVSLPTERLSNSETEAGAKTSAETNWQNRDRPLGRGLATCLELLRNRNELGSAKAFGRINDKTCDDIKYYDNKGRLLTTKQAYRQQCYSYHNRGPGHKKVQKMLDKEKSLLKQQKKDSSHGSESFKNTKEIMEKTQKSYVVLTKPY